MKAASDQLSKSEVLIRGFRRDNPDDPEPNLLILTDFQKRVKRGEVGISLFRRSILKTPEEVLSRIAVIPLKDGQRLGLAIATWRDLKRVADLDIVVNSGHVSLRTANYCQLCDSSNQRKGCEASQGACFFDVSLNAEALTKLIPQFTIWRRV